MPDEIRAVRRRLAEVRFLLISPSPDEVNRCVPLLEEAITRMQAIQPAPERTGELRALRFELGVVGRVAAGGAEFYHEWARMLAAAAAGYTAAGEPAPLTAAGSLSVRG